MATREIQKAGTPKSLGKSKIITTGEMYLVLSTDCVLLFDIECAITVCLPAAVDSKDKFLYIKFI